MRAGLAERGGSSRGPEAREAGAGGSESAKLGVSAGDLPMATTAARSPAWGARTPAFAVVTVAVHARWGHEGDEALEELEGRKDDLGAPAGGGFGKAVEEARVGGGEGGDASEGVEALEGEGRAGTVAQEALEAGTVVTLRCARKRRC